MSHATPHFQPFYEAAGLSLLHFQVHMRRLVSTPFSVTEGICEVLVFTLLLQSDKYGTDGHTQTYLYAT